MAGADVNLTELIELDHFVEDPICDYLIQTFERSQRTNSANSFFDDMILYPTVMHDREALRYMSEVSAGAAALLAERTGGEDRLYLDTVALACWPAGKGLPPHVDNAVYPGHEAIATPWREYSGLVYLNDDYEGGEIFFPRRDLSIKPRRGMVLIFGAGEDWQHGVRTVKRGRRYTLPMWWTYDETRQFAVEGVVRGRPAPAPRDGGVQPGTAVGGQHGDAEEENHRLKLLVAELMLENQALRALVAKRR